MASFKKMKSKMKGLFDRSASPQPNHEASGPVTHASGSGSASDRAQGEFQPINPPVLPYNSPGPSIYAPAGPDNNPQESKNTESKDGTVVPADSSSNYEGWSGLKLFAHTLNKGASVFGPLKQAADVLISFIGTFETVAKNRKDYQELKIQLDVLFRDVSRYLGDSSPSAITASMKNLEYGIKREADLIAQVRERSEISQYLTAEKDAEEVLGCFQRVQGLLQRLSLNANLDTWKTVDEILTETHLKGLPNSPAAYYRSADSASLRRGGCTENTRVEVLEQLKNWSWDAASQKIYWLNGMAGTGKTTIAYSLCERLDENRTLAASFFCSRQLPECRNVNRIIPSIAYQLSRFSRPFRYAVAPVLETNPDVHNQPILEQFKQLVVQPANQIKNTLPTNLVIVIDALDECDVETGTDRILEVLLSHAHQLPIKFFVTSRPDANILSRMQTRQAEQVKTEMRLHELAHTTVQNDIRTYLKTNLELQLALSEADLTTLVQRSGVLFIYAATVVRYIGANNFARKKRRLEEVLKVSSSSRAESHKDIDVLYTAILQAAFNGSDMISSSQAEMLQILHTVVCACEPLTVSSVAGLLELDSEESVYPALIPLFSVLQVSDVDGRVTTLHESFPNYITSKERSDAFHCNQEAHNTYLAQLCFDQISRPSPCFNICQLESSYLLDKNVPGLESRVEKAISKELFYACRYWGSHMRFATYSQELAGKLLAFLSERLLLWMEVISLKKCGGQGMRIMYEMEEWSQKNRELSDKVRLLVKDAWRFVTSWASSPMQLSTPHIYVSALTFWSASSPIMEHYPREAMHIVKRSSTAMGVRKVIPLGTITTQLELLCLTYSPDSLYIATGAKRGALQIWDTRTGHPAGQPLRGHTNDVNSVAYSLNGKHLVSGSSDCTICIWDTCTNRLISQPLTGHTDEVRSVAFSPNGKHIASGSEDKTVCVWDSSSGSQIFEPLGGHTSSVLSVAYSSNGTRVISGSEDHCICIWDAVTGEMVGGPLKGHTHPILSVAYCPQSTRFASASSDGTIRFWETSDGQVIGNSLKGHTDWVRSISYSPDGARLVSGSDDQTVRMWDAVTGQPIGQPLTGHTDWVISVSYSPDGKYIASASEDGTIHIWDALIGPPVGQPLDSHTSDVSSVAYLPDGKHIVSGSGDHTVRIWDALTGQPVGQPLQGHSERVYSVAYSPDGKHIISGSGDRTIRIWDALTGQAVGQPLRGHNGLVYSVAYSPDGKRIASGSFDATVRIWDALTGEAVGQPLTGHTILIWSVIYSPSGKHIISGSGDQTIRIWDALTGQPVGQALQGHTGGVTSLAYSPNGAYIISGSGDQTICIWDALTGHTVGQPLEGHTGWVSSVTYSHDGKHIISGSDDNTIRIWDAQTGQPVGQPLEGHTSYVRAVACSPDGKFMVSGSEDNTVRVWDLKASPVISESISLHTELPSSSHSASATENNERPKTHICGSACQIDGNHRPWTLNEDGWVVLDGDKLLVWVPPDLREVLIRPHQMLRTSSEYGSLYLDFDNHRMGEHWADHFMPLQSPGLLTE